MPRWSDIARGTRAEREVLLPLHGEAEPVRLLVRPLTGTEEAGAIQAARAYAEARGVKDARAGVDLFDLALQAHRVALAYLDPASPEGARAPMFASAAEVLDSPALGPETIAFLHTHQRAWQDECSPFGGPRSVADLLEATEIIGGGDEVAARRFFWALPPSAQWIWARSTAVQLASSPMPRSEPS